MKSVCVIGHFGEGLSLSNGQTIKTKIVTDELKRELGEDQISTIDSHGGVKTLLKAPFQCLKALKISKNVLIFPAYKGLRIYAPLLKFFRPFYKGRKLHYVVIGGWLPEFLKNKKSLKRSLLKFDGVYVETNSMKFALEEQGFKNIYVMPNFKKLRILKKDELVYPKGSPLRLCTFSRVAKAKGIEDAVVAVKHVNESLGFQAYSLDIYGAIDEREREWFALLSKDFPSYISYKGAVSQAKSTEILPGYFALLFPTYYPGEGFAGTLIDALSSGLPIIASDWRYNKDIVNDGTGILYPAKNTNALESVLLKAAENPARLLKCKENCLVEAANYESSKAMAVLLENL